MAETKKLSEMKEEEISAFAFDVGKSIETFIKLVNDNLEEKNKDYEMLILSFRSKVEAVNMPLLLNMYDEHFRIVKHTRGTSISNIPDDTSKG